MNDWRPDSLSLQLLGTGHHVETRLEAALEPLGLSLAKYGVLAKLAAAGEPLPLRTLAELCACVRSNITQLIDRLEADKLVVRVGDPHDRRSIRAQLTPEGRSRQTAAAVAIARAEEELYAHLPEDRRERLIDLLRSLREG